jgi:hypothetical protein
MAAIRTALREFSLRNDIYAGASVTAYVPDANGNPTAVLATLYAAQTGINILPNPQILDGEGKFQQPVYFDAAVVLTVNSAFAASHNTGVIRPSLSDTDVINAQAAATAAQAAAAAAATSAAAADASLQQAAATWPTYWRHPYLSTVTR